MSYMTRNWDVNAMKDIVGKTMKSVTRGDSPHEDESLWFETVDGEKYMMRHDQNCCESVSIEDIAGDLDWLVGSPILSASERSEEPPNEGWDSATWTFYVFETVKGSVTIRWFGSSNGYYSETASLHKMEPST